MHGKKCVTHKYVQVSCLKQYNKKTPLHTCSSMYTTVVGMLIAVNNITFYALTGWLRRKKTKRKGV